MALILMVGIPHRKLMRMRLGSMNSLMSRSCRTCVLLPRRLMPALCLLLSFAVSAGVDHPSYLEATSAQASGDYAAALTAYREYLQQNRDSGRDSALVTKVSARVSVIADAQARGIDGALSLYLDALDLREERDTRTARDLLQQLMDEFPDSYLKDDALYLSGYMALMDEHDFSTAHEVLRELQLGYPDSSYLDTALYGEAVALEQLGNTEGAKARFSELRDRHTQFSLALFDSYWPKATYLSRYWFDRANNRISMLEQRQQESATLVARSSASEPGYELRVHVNVDGIQLPLLLKPSAVARGTNYVDDELQALDFNDTRLYAGKVEDDPDSWVRVSLRGNAIEGVVSAYGVRYELTPDTMIGTIDYYKTRSRAPSGLPELQDYVMHPPLDAAASAGVITLEPMLAAAMPGDISRLVRLNVVVDSQYNDFFGGSGLVEAMSALNVADGIYREHFGLAIEVENVTVYTDRATDPMNLGAVTLENMLRSFREYRLDSELSSPDIGLSYLFSGNQNTDEAIGLAWIGAVCRSDGFDVGVTTPTGYSDLLVTHELGHSLGAQHDTDTTCSSDRNLLMWPRISQTTEQNFSSCSSSAVSTGIDKSCMQNTLDLSLHLESDGHGRILAQVSNLDSMRTAPAAILSVDVATVDLAQVPNGCEQSSGTDLRCQIPALRAGEAADTVFNLATTPVPSSAMLARVEPVGFSDVLEDNNLAQLNLTTTETGDLVWQDGVVDSDVDNLVALNSAAADSTAGGSAASGGGGALLWLLAGGIVHRINRWRLRLKTAVSAGR